MKSAMICIGMIAFLAYSFLLYCCVKVSADAERLFQNIAEKKMRQDEKNIKQN